MEGFIRWFAEFVSGSSCCFHSGCYVKLEGKKGRWRIGRVCWGMCDSQQIEKCPHNSPFVSFWKRAKIHPPPPLFFTVVKIIIRCFLILKSKSHPLTDSRVEVLNGPFQETVFFNLSAKLRVSWRGCMLDKEIQCKCTLSNFLFFKINIVY